MSKDDGGPAYPAIGMQSVNGQPVSFVINCGMSLRDAIALSARHEDLPIPEKVSDCASMLGVPASEWNGSCWMQLVAKLRYEYADIVLKERAK